MAWGRRAAGAENPAAGISHGRMPNSFTSSIATRFTLRSFEASGRMSWSGRQRGSPLRPDGIESIIRQQGVVPQEPLSEDRATWPPARSSRALAIRVLAAEEHPRKCTPNLSPERPRTELGGGGASAQWREAYSRLGICPRLGRPSVLFPCSDDRFGWSGFFLTLLLLFLP